MTGICRTSWTSVRPSVSCKTRLAVCEYTALSRRVLLLLLQGPLHAMPCKRQGHLPQMMTCILFERFVPSGSCVWLLGAWPAGRGGLTCGACKGVGRTRFAAHRHLAADVCWHYCMHGVQVLAARTVCNHPTCQAFRATRSASARMQPQGQGNVASVGM